jgi:hypothetical protein
LKLALYRSVVVVDVALTGLCAFRWFAPLRAFDDWWAFGTTAVLSTILNLVTPVWRGVLSHWGIDADHFLEGVVQRVPVPSSIVGAMILFAAAPGLAGLYHELAPLTIVSENGGEPADCDKNQYVPWTRIGDGYSDENPTFDPSDFDNTCRNAFSSGRQRVVLRTGYWVPAGSYVLTLSTETKDAFFEDLLATPSTAQGIDRDSLQRSLSLTMTEPVGTGASEEHRGAPANAVCWFTMQGPGTEVKVLANLRKESVTLDSTTAVIEIKKH